MSARLALAFVAVTSALSLGCGASGRAEVSITDLVMMTRPDGTLQTGSFNLHVARPASASGSSGILLHTLEVRGAPVGLLGGLAVMRLRSEPPGDVEPGAESVSSVVFDLRSGLTIGTPPFDACAEPTGFFVSATYFDEAEGAFFTVDSPKTWLSPPILTGTTWAETFGDALAQSGHDAAVFPDGSSVLVGSIADATDAMATPAPFVIQLDAAGTKVWERSMALSSPSQVLTATPDAMGLRFVAASPNGGIVAAGVLDGTLDLGDGKVITSAGETDVFLARLDATGKTVEARRFGDVFAQTVSAMDVDAAGNVVLVGTLAGAIDFGAGAVGPLISPTVTSYYVARLPEVGPPIYTKGPLALAEPTRFAAAVGSEGTVILGGSFTGNAWLGAELPSLAMFEAGFLLALAPDGSIAWTSVSEGAVVTQVGIDQGDVVAVMIVRDKAIVGGTELSGGAFGTVMLARFDPAGALLQAVPLGDAGALDVTSLVIDSAGHSLLSGTLTSSLSLAGSTAEAAGRSSSFFAELDRSGVHVRSLAFGCSNAPADLAVARTGSRDVLMVSTFSGAVDFGKGTIPSAGSTDLLVAKLPAQ